MMKGNCYIKVTSSGPLTYKGWAIEHWESYSPYPDLDDESSWHVIARRAGKSFHSENVESRRQAWQMVKRQIDGCTSTSPKQVFKELFDKLYEVEQLFNIGGDRKLWKHRERANLYITSFESQIKLFIEEVLKE